MPSASERTLRARVAWTTALSAVLASLFTAAIAGALSWTLALGQEDRRLGDMLHVLAAEWPGPDAPDERARRTLDDEQREHERSGVRFAALRRGRPLVAGVDQVASGCHTVERSSPVRRCTMAAGADALVAEVSLASLDAHRSAFVRATAAALFVVAALALWASRRTAAFAIEPLDALRSAVATLRDAPEDPRALDAVRGYAELEALRVEFSSLLRQLGASLGQARRFAFDAAHEWRTPLATLRAELDLLAERSSEPAVEQLRALAVELSARLDRVLVLANATVLDRGEPVSLDSVVDDVRRALDERQAARVRVTTDEEGLVCGDAALLQMLVRNAVDNALKFSDGEVRVAVSRDLATVRLTVEDDGVGVDPSEAERVFEPFYRGARARTSGASGSGLGLALLGHIARLHRGAASFEPCARGARLAVTLPAWEP